MSCFQDGSHDIRPPLAALYAAAAAASCHLIGLMDASQFLIHAT